MKKSIKYAGITAATLLAVAPVAAPVVSSVTTVQAADVVYPTATDAGKYKDQFLKSDTYTPAQAKSFTAADYNADNSDKLSTPIGAKVFLTDNTFFKQFLDNNSITSKIDDTNGKITAISAFENGDSTNALSFSDAQSILNNANGKGVTFNITLTYNNGAATTDDEIISISLTPAKEEAAKTVSALKATFTTPYKVAYNSSTSDAKLQKSTDLALADQDGNNLLTDSSEVTSYSLGNFYGSYASALNNGTAASVGSTFTTTDGSAATYYQPITVTVAKDSLLATYLTSNSNSSSYTINGASKTESDNGKVSGSTITFVRTVKVGAENESDWTVKDASGVVNTKTDKEFYTLHNDNDELVSNRALAKGSSWQTDKVRTNAAGEKQYRVSTHEWIPAENVNFTGSESGTDTGSTTDPEGALTVTKLDKNKIVNISTSGMVYFLYNSKGVRSDTRALGGGTSWQVDKTATDAAGNTYYGVSTDEFVKAGEGVSLAN
ncbi:SLAP domain-containing protein [Companilactobacillus baiquanensis]|uniref:SLAP domain-containing protein n=1 Tax=Companilactobacillus baiquanensis TaxID=2486005 RepID=A0ABW1US99_9LACO|nr:SLAP domain-containing protein [Companilactobacillus baiquanensis]